MKIEKVVGKAAQGIRSILIKCYENFYEALKSNAAAQVTSNEYNEQLRELRQRKKGNSTKFLYTIPTHIEQANIDHN
jgi:hypothetical protein